VPILEAGGVEPFLGDPDRVGTLVAALEHVSAVCLLLGSAAGEPDAVAALHGPRLQMLLVKLVDTTVRGVVYEAAGSAPANVLENGAALVREACQRSHISFGLLRADPAASAAWLEEATAALDSVANG
jgi:uncharacterized protein YbjT (DUF2867 family)